MKKTICLLIIVATTLQINAQLLWKVQRENGPTSYIFGTHHLSNEAFADSIGVFDVINHVETVIGELSLDDIESMKNNPALAAMLLAPQDSTLDKLFSPDEIKEIDQAFTALSVGNANTSITKSLNNFKPVMISQLMTVLLNTEGGTIQQTPLDMAILSRAAEAGKTITGFETIDQQARLLYCSPIASQAKALLTMVRLDDYGKKMTDDLTTAYRNQDLNAIMAMFDNNDMMDPETRKTLIDDRNDAWVDFLIGFLPTSSALIICGVGHLPGAKGLLTQLSNNGFTVQPVTTDSH